MKARVILTLCIVMGIAASALAQDVNGLKVGEKYTKNQIIAALGKPDNINGNTYEYGSSYFNFDYVDNTFTGFCIVNDKRFLTMTEEISGGLRIGDNVSKVKQTKCPKKLEKPNYISFWHYGDWADWDVEFDNNGTITYIGFTILS
ncbi:MAG: hypothetical protein KBS89_06655 [Bacteroidales bacterium]|nr:hypothetical protein [Candidatus Egerieousia equi]